MSEGLPIPFPICASGLRHMTFPILNWRSLSPLSFRAQSRSHSATLLILNWPLSSSLQSIITLSGFVSGEEIWSGASFWRAIHGFIISYLGVSSPERGAPSVPLQPLAESIFSP